MKKLNLKEVSAIHAGDRVDRWFKQVLKCHDGSARACRRAARLRDRLP